jgi:hypothetical protein
VCRGIELDPLYVDVIIRRYEALTRSTAILADTGTHLKTHKRHHADYRAAALPIKSWTLKSQQGSVCPKCASFLGAVMRGGGASESVH